ncbi:hypothetical protein PHLGIDRAFT_94612 [Phlebiopsis gigantea 11061_1 CR5-6]|uniref:DNA-(apurinic or apyrimidinic site) endonuclease n=1 Tax=Phlebiopsis gigantea (strain 11061_1 CR5-6) TaxID=745531 RepID=A0A0C3PDX3_PHLG1|nr:hypothetical protein PHLGIDRAFT_94612 [Phlebiopsis gigantea 11061_1 CR5-6]
MRILSWNINGIRTLPQYHPWNTMKNCQGILDEIGADIICFQEMKSSRAVLPRDVAIPDNYASFFSFPVTKGGYSGVAVYTKSSSVVPLKAEEGLSGRLQPKPPLSPAEHISPQYPSMGDITAYSDEEGGVPATFDLLDSEGRGLVVDFGLFVLINVYCPNETSDARLSFKMNYHLLLQERVRRLISEGREVIVLGDMNICASPIDHCDGHLPSNASTFWEHPARGWFRSWLSPDGPMVDVVRSFWPDRKGMYTCWNLKIQARETNYGSRIDYVLVTKGLLKWIKHGDIQPSIKGSDHCPIYVDMHEEIVLESGETFRLRDQMQMTGTPRDPPRLAAKNWEEFSAKQTLLSAFFGKKVGASPSAKPPSASPKVRPPISPAPTSQSNAEAGPSTSRTAEQSNKKRALARPSSTAAAKKKARTASTQQTLRPRGSTTSTKTASNTEIIVLDSDPDTLMLSQGSQRTATQEDSIGVDSRGVAGEFALSAPSTAADVLEADNNSDTPVLLQRSQQDEDQVEADYRFACRLAAAQETAPADSPTPPGSSSDSKAAWSTLFTPVQPPKCTVHGEPTKKHTVNKAGPNKGRAFYVCSRPVGPGYDKGKAERLRHEVNHEYRCNYFKWASDVKRETSANTRTS